MGARYSRQSGYTVTRRAPVRRPTQRTVGRRIKFGPTTAKFLGLAVVAILAIVMVTQSSSNATTAYKQNGIKQDISQANQDIEQLQLEARRAQSLQSIQNTPVKDQMQENTKTDYVEKGEVAGASTAKP